MESLSEWINNNKTLVELFSSITSLVLVFYTLVFTIIYVRATWKLVHFPYKAFVKPLYIKVGNHLGIWFFTIKNYGPGLASNVEVFCNEIITIKKETNRKDAFSFVQATKLDGNSEISPNDENTYCLLGIPSFPVEVIISWYSITGKKYKHSWKILDNHSSNLPLIINITKIHNFSYFLLRSITLPYVLIKKRIYNETGYTFFLILKRLKNKGFMSYDYISDELTKSDDEVKELLSLMKRKGLVTFNSEDVEITSDGINKLEQLRSKYQKDSID